MTLSDDLQGEMRRPWLDDDTADRLLAGLVAPDDAPPGYAQVTSIVRAATAPPSARELAQEIEHVAAAVRTVDAVRIAPLPVSSRSTMGSRFSRTKIVAAMVAGTLAGTTGLAMASVLPAPAQDVVSGVLAKVGISVPSSHDHPASTGEEISRIATTTDSTGVDKGAEISGVASGGMSQAGQHGAGNNGAGSHGAANNGAADHGAANNGAADHGAANNGAADHGAGQHGAGSNVAADHGGGGGPAVGAEHSGDHSAEGSGNAPDPPAPSTSSHGNPAGS